MAGQKKRERRDASRERAVAEADAPVLDKPAPQAESRLRGWHKGLALFGAMTAVPALFFVTVELGLGVVGFGYPTAYFIPWEVEGQPAHVDNLEFTRRFFPSYLERMPYPCVVPADKGEGTIRIFILGASAAQGDPDWNFSFGRILEVLLKDRYPGTSFEIINTGMTAINSHVVLPIARDCARQNPDLFVIYLGNNEVVGPFGAGSVLHLFSGNLLVIRAGLEVKRTKVGQLMDSLLQRIGAQGRPTTWRGLAMFTDSQVRHDHPRMEAVYRNYRRNLTDIAEAALDAGAGVILCTVGVNEGDWGPFGSLHAPGLSNAQKAMWQESYQEGVALEDAGHWTAAIQRFSETAVLDDTYAELQFRLGRCTRALGRLDEAKRRFALARDLDTLRFRADSRINETVEAVATELADKGVLLADVKRVLSDASPNGIPGSEFFHDQVHLTFAGNYLIARTVLDQVAQALPDSLGATGPGKHEILSEEACAQRLAFTPWDLASHLSELYEGMLGPPYTGQCDHEVRMADLSKRRDTALRLEFGRGFQIEAAAAYRDLLSREPQDALTRLKLAILLLDHGDPVEAEEELRRLVRQLPHRFRPQIFLGRALELQDDDEGAEAHYREMLKVYPKSAALHEYLAMVLRRGGHIPEAIKEFRATLKLDPYSSKDAHLFLGELLIGTGRAKEAAALLRRSIELSPANPKMHNMLGTALAKMRQPKEALIQYQRAVALDPIYVDALRNVAHGLWWQKDYDGAWDAVRRCRLNDGQLDPEFIAVLERDSGSKR